VVAPWTLRRLCRLVGRKGGVAADDGREAAAAVSALLQLGRGREHSTRARERVGRCVVSAGWGAGMAGSCGRASHPTLNSRAGRRAQALSQDLLAATLEIPFAVPPYMALLARAVATLEGIALLGNPDYQMVSQVWSGRAGCAPSWRPDRAGVVVDPCAGVRQGMAADCAFVLRVVLACVLALTPKLGRAPAGDPVRQRPGANRVCSGQAWSIGRAVGDSVTDRCRALGGAVPAQAYPFIVRKVLRDAGPGSNPLLRDIVLDAGGGLRPARLAALLNAALGRVAARADGFVDLDAVPDEGASLQARPLLWAARRTGLAPTSCWMLSLPAWRPAPECLRGPVRQRRSMAHRHRRSRRRPPHRLHGGQKGGARRRRRALLSRCLTRPLGRSEACRHAGKQASSSSLEQGPRAHQPTSQWCIPSQCSTSVCRSPSTESSRSCGRRTRL